MELSFEMAWSRFIDAVRGKLLNELTASSGKMSLTRANSLLWDVVMDSTAEYEYMANFISSLPDGEGKTQAEYIIKNELRFSDHIEINNISKALKIGVPIASAAAGASIGLALDKGPLVAAITGGAGAAVSSLAISSSEKAKKSGIKYEIANAYIRQLDTYKNEIARVIA
jgi:hypothetical protein